MLYSVKQHINMNSYGPIYILDPQNIRKPQAFIFEKTGPFQSLPLQGIPVPTLYKVFRIEGASRRRYYNVPLKTLFFLERTKGGH